MIYQSVIMNCNSSPFWWEYKHFKILYRSFYRNCIVISSMDSFFARFFPLFFDLSSVWVVIFAFLFYLIFQNGGRHEPVVCDRALASFLFFFLFFSFSFFFFLFTEFFLSRWWRGRPRRTCHRCPRIKRSRAESDGRRTAAIKLSGAVIRFFFFFNKRHKKK